jgi:hypothetical protein
MTSAQLLTDGFGRIRQVVHRAAGGLTPRQLAHRPVEGANSIGWLIWHLTRIQDDHVADAAGTVQAWTDDGWADRFDLPFDPFDTGSGHTPEDVAAVRVEDDGVGIPEGGRRSGLRNMRERAEALGGSFSTRARPAGGTILVWRVPLGDGRQV